MEINVTRLATEAELFGFSASRAERGANAGPETWANAKAEAAERPILTDDQLPAFRDYVRGFGAWSDEGIDGWSPTECNALFVQMVAGDLREAESLCYGEGPGEIDWAEYERLAEAGTVPGRVYASDSEIYYYVGD